MQQLADLIKDGTVKKLYLFPSKDLSDGKRSIFMCVGEEKIVTIKNRITGGRVNVALEQLRRFFTRKRLKKELLRLLDLELDHKRVHVHFRLVGGNSNCAHFP